MLASTSTAEKPSPFWCKSPCTSFNNLRICQILNLMPILLLLLYFDSMSCPFWQFGSLWFFFIFPHRKIILAMIKRNTQQLKNQSSNNLSQLTCKTQQPSSITFKEVYGLTFGLIYFSYYIFAPASSILSTTFSATTKLWFSTALKIVTTIQSQFSKLNLLQSIQEFAKLR